jgi:hypothetical protein
MYPIYVQRTLCDTGTKGKRSIDLDEKKSRKKRTTTIGSQFETRQTLDLFFGSSGLEASNDFHFGETFDDNVRGCTICGACQSQSSKLIS